MDGVYSGKKKRTATIELDYALIVPPKRNFKEQWECDEDLYKQRNEVACFLVERDNREWIGKNKLC